MVSTDALVLYDALMTDAIDGTVLKDFSGNGRDATITGGLNMVDDGFVFTGDNQVYLNGIGNPSGDWPHTISIWMNTDATTQVTNEFPELVNARYVRITVMGFYGHPAMRAAVLGYTAS